MRNRNRYIIYFLITVALAFALIISSPASMTTMNQSRGTIVIDAGHGGFDGGAIGRLTGAREDVLNLIVAKKLQRLFEINGYTVIMTRSDDSAVASTKSADMQKRKEIIENSGADVVISIHMNKFNDTSCSGPMAFYHEDSTEGKELAISIQQQLNEMLDPPRPRTYKPETYYILRSGNCPSVLVECGFLSNEREEELLQTDEYQEKCARAIFRGTVNYLNQIAIAYETFLYS